VTNADEAPMFAGCRCDLCEARRELAAAKVELARLAAELEQSRRRLAALAVRTSAISEN
jgi:hypothetical protein